MRRDSTAWKRMAPSWSSPELPAASAQAGSRPTTPRGRRHWSSTASSWTSCGSATWTPPRELEAYRSGLAAQLEGRVGTEEQAAAPVLPTSFSWLTEAPACLDYVHHQGDCGACYMFAALDSLSDRHCINRKKTSTLGTVDHLSIQMGILCEPLGRQCAGGWADIGFNYTQLFGMNTEAEWPYERSCLSPTVCQFGSQCITPMDYECTDFFSASELDKIKTFEDALAQADNKCSGKAVIQKDACKTWASTTFGKSPSLVFLPGKAFCRNLSREFREFLLRPRSGAPTALNSLAKQQGSVHRTDAGGTSKARGGVAAGAGSLGDVGTSGNAVLAAASPAVLLSSPASPVGVAALSASVDNANRTVWATGDSNSTCCCEGFFSDNKQHRLSTFGDAWLQASAKCEAIPQLHACKAWADRTFGATPSAAFRPTQGLCSRVRAEFSAFARLPLVEEAALLTGGGEEYAALGVQQAGRGQWWWARRRRSRKSKTPEKRAERTTREEEKPEKRAERTSREEEKPEWSNTRPTPAPAGAADSAARRCDRSRCQRESRPHLLTAYHYIPNSKDKFKEELYQEGPFYTSFYVYEDFPWFFRFWPAQAYNRQWGQNLGGHAVVLIGWEASCVYHNGPSLLQLEDSTGLQGRAARHHAQSTTSRRRTSTAECWHLRNTWGRGWADEGYFRMKDDMLTGPEGAHVHIASAAGDGPKSRSG